MDARRQATARTAVAGSDGGPPELHPEHAVRPTHVAPDLHRLSPPPCFELDDAAKRAGAAVEITAPAQAVKPPVGDSIPIERHSSSSSSSSSE
jgi:hypothetical protein